MRPPAHNLVGDLFAVGSVACTADACGSCGCRHDRRWTAARACRHRRQQVRDSGRLRSSKEKFGVSPRPPPGQLSGLQVLHHNLAVGAHILRNVPPPSPSARVTIRARRAIGWISNWLPAAWSTVPTPPSFRFVYRLDVVRTASVPMMGPALEQPGACNFFQNVR